MLTIYPITTLALVLALIVYFALSVNVGRARATWNVPAPQASGHPEFDKRYRVQMNTLEQLALFVPGVIVGAPVLGDLVAGGLAGQRVFEAGNDVAGAVQIGQRRRTFRRVDDLARVVFQGVMERNRTAVGDLHVRGSAGMD